VEGRTDSILKTDKKCGFKWGPSRVSRCTCLSDRDVCDTLTALCDVIADSMSRHAPRPNHSKAVRSQETRKNRNTVLPAFLS
jgi:hypothetical protein